jgi:hypothetical protein
VRLRGDRFVVEPAEVKLFPRFPFECEQYTSGLYGQSGRRIYAWGGKVPYLTQMCDSHRFVRRCSVTPRNEEEERAFLNGDTGDGWPSAETSWEPSRAFCTYPSLERSTGANSGNFAEGGVVGEGVFPGAERVPPVPTVTVPR